jgi:hypothetical protein
MTGDKIASGIEESRIPDRLKEKLPVTRQINIYCTLEAPTPGRQSSGTEHRLPATSCQ